MNPVALETVLASLESGARPIGGASADSGEIPSLGGEHLNANGGFEFRSIKRIPRPFFESIRGGRIESRDILVVKDGATTGKTSFVGEDFPFREAAVNEHVFCVRVDQSKAWPEYVFHFLRSPGGQRSIALDFRGATVGGISRDFAKKVRLPSPTLPEQRRIAGILDKADALRAKRRAALAQLDTLARSYFLDLHEKAKNCSRVVPLSRVAEASRGSFVNGPFGSHLLTRELQDEGVPVVYIRDIRDGEYDRVSTSCVTARKAQQLAVCSVRSGDVLVAKVGDPPGVAAVYPDSEPPAIVTQDVIRIRVAREIALPQFVVSYLNSLIGRWKIESIVIEATRARFSLKDFKALSIELPPVALQREFTCRMEAVEKLKAWARASLRQLDLLFASLQHRAFRGDL